MDPVHFAMIGIISLAFGLVTPPYGLCLMISCAIAKVRLMYVMKDVMIMLMPMLGVLAATIVFPEIILFLPRLDLARVPEVIRFRHARPASASRPTASTWPQPLADADFAELERAFYAHHVLALRGQDIDAAQFLAFARRIGPPQPHVIDQFHHPDDPNILILSNVKKDGKPTGLQDAGSYFHTDYSYLQVPARATTLYSRVVPKRRRRHAVRRPAGGLRRPARGDEAAHRAAAGDPPLRQPPRRRRGEPHRRLGAERRAEGEDAGDHAPDRPAASGHRQEGALRRLGQLVRHRRHARRRSARPARRARRALDRSRATSCAFATASATSSSGTTPRCSIRRR